MASQPAGSQPQPTTESVISSKSTPSIIKIVNNTGEVVGTTTCVLNKPSIPVSTISQSTLSSQQVKFTTTMAPTSRTNFQNSAPTTRLSQVTTVSSNSVSSLAPSQTSTLPGTDHLLPNQDCRKKTNKPQLVKSSKSKPTLTSLPPQDNQPVTLTRDAYQNLVQNITRAVRNEVSQQNNLDSLARGVPPPTPELQLRSTVSPNSIQNQSQPESTLPSTSEQQMQPPRFTDPLLPFDEENHDVPK